MRVKAIYELYNSASTMDRGKVYDVDNNLLEIDEALVQTKIAELQVAEPMRLLRLERDRLISSTDWWVLPDRTPTQAQLDFRQALRDLPSNSPNAALDEHGNLINVEWPEMPA